MSDGIHGQLNVHATHERLPRLREAGWRVTVGEDGANSDVTDLVSGLRYGSRLPGGFADCSFSLHMSLSRAAPFLTHLAPVQVHYGGSLAWEGRVEEPPRGAFGTEALPVMALGRGSEAKAQKFTKLFVTSGYGRWKGAWELIEGQTQPVNAQSYSPGFAPDANANPGFLVGFPNGSPANIDSDDAAWIWVPPAGCDILRVKGSLNAVGASASTNTALYALTALAGYAGATAETILAGRAISAGDTTFDDTLSATGIAYLRIDFDQGSTGTAATDEFFHYHSMQIVGARTAEGDVFDPAQVTTYAVIRSLLSEFCSPAIQSSDENMQLTQSLGTYIAGATLMPSYAWSDLVFDTPTTVEDAINRLNSVVGWEWGVFEDGLFYYGPIHTITTIGRTPLLGSGNVKSWPPWWLACMAQDGHSVRLIQSTSDIVNEVRVSYTDASGVQKIYYASDFTNAQNPLNLPDGSGPRQKRTGTVDIPGQSDLATATAMASAYLAQYSRPQVKGEVTWAGLVAPKVEVGSLSFTQLDAGTSTPEYMPTPLIRPGHWIEVGDAEGLVDVSWQTMRPPTGVLTGYQTTDDRAASSRVLPIRSVEVDCDAGRVTCSVDSSRDVFGVALAQLQQKAAA